MIRIRNTSDRLLSALTNDDLSEIKATMSEENFSINQIFQYSVWGWNGYQKSYPYTILSYALKNEKHNILNHFFEIGADASLVDITYLSAESLLKHLPKLIKNGFDLIDNLDDIVVKDHDKDIFDDYLVTFLIDHSIDVNTVIRKKSLLSIALGDEFHNLPKATKYLLDNGAQAGDIIVDRNTNIIVKNIAELVKAGFNLENNFLKLEAYNNDEWISLLLEKDVIKPDFKFRLPGHPNEYRSLIELLCNNQMQQSLQMMAKKGFKFDVNYSLENGNIYFSHIYQPNILVLAEMGLNFTNPNNNLLLDGLEESVLIELISKDLLDVNISIGSGFGISTILQRALYGGQSELVKILLENGADASDITLPSYAPSDEGFLEKTSISNLDGLIKNGFKLSGANLSFILNTSRSSIDLIASFLDKGFINPTDVINSMITDYIENTQFKSKEFLDLLLSKGLKVNDTTKNGYKISEYFPKLFTAEALIPLFKNGILQVTPEFIFSCAPELSWSSPSELIIKLVEENLLSNDSVFNEIPLLSIFQRNELVRDYLIKSGSFESLNQIQREDLIIKTMRYVSNEKAIELLKILQEKHNYKLGEYEFSQILSMGSSDYIIYALRNGIDVNKPFSADLRDINGIALAGFLPIQAAFILKLPLSLIKTLLKNGADITAQTKEAYSPLTLGYIHGYKPDVDVYYSMGMKPHILDLLFVSSDFELSLFKHFFGDIDLNQTIHLPNKESYPQFYKSYSKFEGVENLTFAHFIVAYLNNLHEIADIRLKNKIDLNLKDSAGRTPIFYTNDEQVVTYLIQHGAKTDIVDNNGNTLLHTTSELELLKLFRHHGADHNQVNNLGQKWYVGKPIVKLIKNGLLTESEFKSIPKLLNLLLQKGEVLDADKFYKQGCLISYELKQDLVESIKLGMSSSLEINKYQALIGVFNKYGIQLPSFLYKYLNDPKDYESTKELKMILSDQFLNQLVDQYLSITGIEANSLNEYTTYTTNMDKVVKTIEEDLAIEILAINKLTLLPLKEEHFVYRGLKLPDISGFIAHNFLHGHKALFNTGVHNFAFHAEEPWSKTLRGSYSWEFAGNYASFSKEMAKQFATWATTSKVNTGGVIMEIKVGPYTKFVCGRNNYESEIITLSTIPVEAIKSITILSTGEVMKNPSYIESALDQLEPLTEEQMVANYVATGCKKYTEDNKNIIKEVGEFYSYENFIATFTPAALMEHRKNVYLAAEQTEMCLEE